MIATLRKPGMALAAVTLMTSVFISGVVLAMAPMKINLTGAEEVPPVKTSAKGTGSITVGDDNSVSGSVKTTGVKGTMAHVHQGAKGENGPPIITLTKGSGDEWTIPAGAKLTDEQLKSLKDGNLYVNVHSDAHKGGEIRAQLKP
jgi:hypothetical protein